MRPPTSFSRSCVNELSFVEINHYGSHLLLQELSTTEGWSRLLQHFEIPPSPPARFLVRRIYGLRNL